MFHAKWMFDWMAAWVYRLIITVVIVYTVNWTFALIEYVLGRKWQKVYSINTKWINCAFLVIMYDIADVLFLWLVKETNRYLKGNSSLHANVVHFNLKPVFKQGGIHSPNITEILPFNRHISIWTFNSKLHVKRSSPLMGVTFDSVCLSYPLSGVY